jgi:predicted RNase H-like HicB family nuclease
MKVSIQIEKAEFGYFAHSPEIPGSQIRGATFDPVMNEIKETIRAYLNSTSQPTPNSTGKSLLALFDDITADMTADKMAQLPKDGTAQHDHLWNPKKAPMKQLFADTFYWNQFAILRPVNP